MNKELLKEYLSSRYQGWSSFLHNVIFPILVKMTLRMVLKQSFWKVSLNENNWQKRREYAASSKLE